MFPKSIFVLSDKDYSIDSADENYSDSDSDNDYQSSVSDDESSEKDFSMSESDFMSSECDDTENSEDDDNDGNTNRNDFESNFTLRNVLALPSTESHLIRLSEDFEINPIQFEFSYKRPQTPLSIQRKIKRTKKQKNQCAVQSVSPSLPKNNRKRKSDDNDKFEAETVVSTSTSLQLSLSQTIAGKSKDPLSPAKKQKTIEATRAVSSRTSNATEYAEILDQINYFKYPRSQSRLCALCTIQKRMPFAFLLSENISATQFENFKRID